MVTPAVASTVSTNRNRGTITTGPSLGDFVIARFRDQRMARLEHFHQALEGVLPHQRILEAPQPENLPDQIDHVTRPDLLEDIGGRSTAETRASNAS